MNLSASCESRNRTGSSPSEFAHSGQGVGETSGCSCRIVLAEALVCSAARFPSLYDIGNYELVRSLDVCPMVLSANIASKRSHADKKNSFINQFMNRF